MKMGTTLTVRPPVSPAALRILRAAPNVDAVVVNQGGHSTLAVAFKPQVTASDARVLADRLSESEAPAIVVAKTTTKRAREALQELGIGVVDAAGNAHIELPGVVIHVEGQPRPSRERPDGLRIGGKTAVVVQSLLLQPEREWKLTDLAERARVSIGTAHRVTRFLEQRDLLSAEGSGSRRRRRVANPGALLDLLAEELRDPGAQTLLAYRFAQTGSDLPHAISASLRGEGIDHAITGIAAANVMAPFLTVVPVVSVWITAEVPLTTTAQATGAAPADRGANLVFMQVDDDSPLAFAQEHDHLRLANVFRIYVDASRDPQRGAEQAEHFRREVIAF